MVKGMMANESIYLRCPKTFIYYAEYTQCRLMVLWYFYPKPKLSSVFGFQLLQKKKFSAHFEKNLGDFYI